MVIETEEKTLTASNRGWLKVEPINPGYYPPSLTITVLRDPPDAESLKSKKSFADGSFHGLPALIAFGKQGKYWAYQAIFKDRDRWFEITLSMPDYDDVPKSSWWPYIDSFIYDPQKAKKPTPATKPQLDLTFTTTFPSTAPARESAEPAH